MRNKKDGWYWNNPFKKYDAKDLLLAWILVCVVASAGIILARMI